MKTDRKIPGSLREAPKAILPSSGNKYFPFRNHFSRKNNKNKGYKLAKNYTLYFLKASRKAPGIPTKVPRLFYSPLVKNNFQIIS